MEDIINKHFTKVKKGNKKSMEAIMDFYMNSVFYLAKSIIGSCGSNEDIEECVQDTFYKVWKNSTSYDESRGSLKAFILIIAKNEALNKRKTLILKYSVANIEDIQVKANESTENIILEKENKKEILNIIEKLKPIDKEIVIKRYFYNMKISDIAQEVNMSTSAVENRLWRVKGKLKLIFEANIKEVK